MSTSALSTSTMPMWPSMWIDQPDALGRQRGHQPGMLPGDQVNVGRLRRLPVPAAGGIDQGLRTLTPAVGANALVLVPRPPHQHRAQPADLVRGAPLGTPHQTLLRGLLERRLRLGRTEPDGVADRVGVWILGHMTLCSGRVRPLVNRSTASGATF